VSITYFALRNLHFRLQYRDESIPHIFPVHSITLGKYITQYSAISEWSNILSFFQLVSEILILYVSSQLQRQIIDGIVTLSFLFLCIPDILVPTILVIFVDYIEILEKTTDRSVISAVGCTVLDETIIIYSNIIVWIL